MSKLLFPEMNYNCINGNVQHGICMKFASETVKITARYPFLLENCPQHLSRSLGARENVEEARLMLD